MLFILNTMKNKESRLKGYSKKFFVANSRAISRALAVNIVNIYLFKFFLVFFHMQFSQGQKYSF